ncbi:hypothetical protein ACIBUY_18260 [Streptomyces sp. NPDC050085]|uniref:hypothetical protein n=1 Tax=Streptomyces sp. NPDC050085 TaxID=3365600 RepID=UPI0037AE4676
MTAHLSRRPGALLVPGLLAVSAALLVARLAFDGDTFRDCHYLGPSGRMYVTSWAGLACTLGALLGYAVLRRGARGPGRLATAAAVVAPLVLLAQLATVYWLYAADPSGGNDCSGLAALLR